MIGNEVVEVEEREWFCSGCVKARAKEAEGGDEEGLVSGEGLTIDEVSVDEDKGEVDGGGVGGVEKLADAPVVDTSHLLSIFPSW